jgi:hypothetical protein
MSDDVRLAALRDAVNAGIANPDTGNGVHIPADGVHNNLRERGRQATERADTTTE